MNQGKFKVELTPAARAKLEQNLMVEYELYNYLAQRIRRQYGRIAHMLRK